MVLQRMVLPDVGLAEVVVFRVKGEAHEQRVVDVQVEEERKLLDDVLHLRLQHRVGKIARRFLELLGSGALGEAHKLLGDVDAVGKALCRRFRNADLRGLFGADALLRFGKLVEHQHRNRNAHSREKAQKKFGAVFHGEVRKSLGNLF